MFKLFSDSVNENFLKFYFQGLMLLERRLRLKTHNALTLREVMILGILDRLSKTNKNTPTNVVKYLQVSAPVISTTIKSLIRKGYLVKRINQEDNRFFFVDLTVKGQESNKNSSEFSNYIVNKALSQMSPLDIKGIYKLFKISEKLIDEENRLLDVTENKTNKLPTKEK
jgi:DNA-binding MarR family transcriptional regulator